MCAPPALFVHLIYTKEKDRVWLEPNARDGLVSLRVVGGWELSHLRICEVGSANCEVVDDVSVPVVGTPTEREPVRVK
jgi:hypothetical protein